MWQPVFEAACPARGQGQRLRDSGVLDELKSRQVIAQSKIGATKPARGADALHACGVLDETHWAAVGLLTYAKETLHACQIRRGPQHDQGVAAIGYKGPENSCALS